MSSQLPKNQGEELAFRVARGLGEEDLLSMYQKLVRKYPKHIVQRAYHETLDVPENKIRKSRGAIFNYLLKRYGGKTKENPGN